ncbi:ferredoxin reductase [Occultella aeris]|uniref:Benzoate 1,2-dioxygenase electron transfer component n=1 Tax=Occultella aeris TaxID=2761496 RepID=A0A7M4DET8_9MICO|nr:Benzoate 1,2-dioxygenase electron transfer component [Occultella aeris]
MAPTALRRRLNWQVADVLRVTAETPTASRLRLAVHDWAGHDAGQHVDVRLTAPDGYTAQRSYSIASPPQAPHLDLVVERLEDGEVSGYMTEELRSGDLLELRGPIGGYFVWPATAAGPVQLIAGGSGVVPFLSMLGQHRATRSEIQVRLLYSARSEADLIGTGELAGPGISTTLTLTRAVPPGWEGLRRRVDVTMLAEHTLAPERSPLVFVCGPTSFVETVAAGLLSLGHDQSRIKTERFGATGGP